MGFAEHDAGRPDVTPAQPRSRPASADLVRYADSGEFQDGGQWHGFSWVPDSAEAGHRDEPPSGGGPGDGGQRPRAPWAPDLTTGAYPVISS
jgi:hypothetical protein